MHSYRHRGGFHLQRIRINNLFVLPSTSLGLCRLSRHVDAVQFSASVFSVSLQYYSGYLQYLVDWGWMVRVLFVQCICFFDSSAALTRAYHH